MKAFSSCKDAIISCMNSKSFAVAHLYNYEATMEMHIHDCYEVYYSISGGKQFLIDNYFYDIQPGDIFFINQYESHYLTKIDETVHERIVLSIHPEFLTGLSTKNTDLSRCFSHRQGNTPHQLHFSGEEQKRFIYLIHKLTHIKGFGSDLLEQTAFTELIVFLNTCFTTGCDATEENTTSHHVQVDEIISYINQNISKTLTIEALASHFFLSSSYLCRIFKAATGTTINKYITAKRITLSKALLSQGLTVTEVCEQCGFNDYSNFLKSFTKAVGISPKKYAQFNS